MREGCILTICICTYNRQKHLKVLLKSIPKNYNKVIEILIIDDGSNDNTKDLVKKFSKSLNINYYFQKNQGRGHSINFGIKIAKGDYFVIMDSDDYFINDGLETIIYTIDLIKPLNKKNVFCILFPTNVSKNFNKLPHKLVSNFLKVRFDYGIKGDLKEIVLTKLLKESIENINIKFRRFPTLYLWAYISNYSDCLCLNKPIAYKNYLDDGISKNIYKNKILNYKPMYNMYQLIENSSKYESKFFRLKSKILFVRYKLHETFYLPSSKQLPYFIIGMSIYFFDKMYLFLNDKH